MKLNIEKMASGLHVVTCSEPARYKGLMAFGETLAGALQNVQPCIDELEAAIAWRDSEIGKEAVPVDTPCHSAEHAMPETTTKGEQR